MKKIFFILLFQAISLALVAQDSQWLKENYSKREVFIPMRDGVELFTAIYEPVGTEISEEHPIIMTRTPYSCKPYGDGYASALSGYMKYFVQNGYIIVFQDVRGRYMSGGVYENIRPFNPNKSADETDEASDTYDSVEWLIRNTSTNGNVGVTGVSYPGFYATMAALSGHPAIKAVSPQAPILDWYKGDDAHHNGVLMLLDTYSFGGSFYRTATTPYKSLPKYRNPIDRNVYDFFMGKETMGNVRASLLEELPFMDSIIAHPDYDRFWKERSLEPYLKDIRPAMLVVGGTFDTDDCYGAVNTYRLIRESSPQTEAYFVYGPWYHGGWHNESYTSLGDVYFGEDISGYFMREIEYPFFRYYLEGKGDKPSSVSIYASGTQGWREYDSWPCDDVEYVPAFLESGGGLSISRKVSRGISSYISDPMNPVPYVEKPGKGRDRTYMVADQGFLDSREDVLSFTACRQDDTLKLRGPVKVSLSISSDSGDVDMIVKLVDVAPDGYWMLVRGDVYRARYRHGLETPEPLKPGKVSEVSFTMPDVAHDLLPGHRLMVQVQSTWFPLVDRNPQKFVVNPYLAEKEDYISAEIKLYHGGRHASCIWLPVMK
ncbi:MAG: CocE/NonD family hydrolase [Clostridium sp.]|nr:CocE/NonD family hydrolase [Bacteroides sp.]MCM1199264.1 CocE/NonD family hydrolase [Clostridium sp.]